MTPLRAPSDSVLKSGPIRDLGYATAFWPALLTVLIFSLAITVTISFRNQHRSPDTRSMAHDLPGSDAVHPRGMLRSFTDAYSGNFSPDGRTLVITTGLSGDHVEVQILAVGSGKIVRTLRGLNGRSGLEFRGLVLSPDSTSLASPRKNGDIVIWDVATGQIKHTFPAPGGNSAKPAASDIPPVYSPDGRTLAVARPNGDIQILDSSTGRPQHLLPAHVNTFGTIAFSPDGTTLATTSAISHVEPAGVTLWDLSTGSTLRTLRTARRHATDWLEQQLTGLTFSPDGKSLATPTFGRDLVIWDLATGTVRHRRHTPHRGSALNQVVFAPDGRTVAESYDLLPDPGYAVRIFDSFTGRLLRTMQGDSIISTGMAYSRDGRHLITVGINGVIKVWETSTGKVSTRFPGDPAGLPRVVHVGYSPDRRLLAMTDRAGGLRIYSIGDAF